MANNIITTPIDSLEAIQMRKAEIAAEINKSDDKLAETWDKMFHQPTAEEENSPTQRALSFISSSAGLIDGALLGWKLYRKFGKTKSFFSRKKK